MSTPRTISMLAAAGLLLAGCASAQTTTGAQLLTPERLTVRQQAVGESTPPTYLFTISSEAGTIDGIGEDTGNEKLALTLAGVNDHATQFADRPIRKAYVLSTADLADRWDRWFSDAAPNAVLSFTAPGDPMPHSVVLTIDAPVYDKAAGTLTFSARHLHRQPDLSPDAKVRVPLPRRQAPDVFAGATLFIDSVEDEALATVAEDPVGGAMGAVSEVSTSGPNYSCHWGYGVACRYWDAPWPNPINLGLTTTYRITFKDGTDWGGICPLTAGWQILFNPGAIGEITFDTGLICRGY